MYILTLIFSLLIFLPAARADFILGAGGLYSLESKSKEKSSYNDKEQLVLDGGIGPALDLEYVLDKHVTIAISGTYRKGKGVAQFRQQTDSTTAIVLDDMEVTATTMAFAIGPRFRLLDFKRYRVVLGGGYTIGTMDLEYDKEQDSIYWTLYPQLKDQESQKLKGYFLELGAEIALSSNQAIRIMARYNSFKTEAFQTLHDKEMNVTQTQALIQLLHFFKF